MNKFPHQNQLSWIIAFVCLARSSFPDVSIHSQFDYDISKENNNHLSVSRQQNGCFLVLSNRSRVTRNTHNNNNNSRVMQNRVETKIHSVNRHVPARLRQSFRLCGTVVCTIFTPLGLVNSCCLLLWFAVVLHLPDDGEPQRLPERWYANYSTGWDNGLCATHKHHLILFLSLSLSPFRLLFHPHIIIYNYDAVPFSHDISICAAAVETESLCWYRSNVQEKNRPRGMNKQTLIVVVIIIATYSITTHFAATETRIDCEVEVKNIIL